MLVIPKEASTEVAPSTTHLEQSPETLRLRSKRWRKHLLWVLILAVLLILWFTWRAYVRAQYHFETATLVRGTIQSSITATGTLNPVVNVQVGSQVSGNIKALFADFNTRVTQGQLVALIDPEIFQAQVDQARSAKAYADAAVLSADAQVKKSDSDLSASIANRENVRAVLAKDRANFLNTTLQWERTKELFATGVISKQEYDTSQAAHDAASAQVQADLSQIDAADYAVRSQQAQAEFARTQWKSALAQSQQAGAALKQSEINLAHTRIITPVSGTVIARHFDVGQTVAASFQAPDIFDIAQDLTKMQVDTNVDESDVGVIRVGQGADFTVDAYPGTIFHGVVADIRKAPIITQNVVTYDAVVTIANPDLKLFPGMIANVTIFTARSENALRVSNAALRFHPSRELIASYGLPVTQGPTLYARSGRGLRAVPVKLGISDGVVTEILGTPDLRPGDAVLTRATLSGQSNTPATPSGTAPSPRRLPGM